MRRMGLVVVAAVVGSLLVAAPTATAVTDQPLATVELDGFTVSTAGYWPGFTAPYGCNSYLFTYSGAQPSQSILIRLEDAASGATLGSSGLSGETSEGTGTINACGAPGPELLRLTLVKLGERSVSSPTFTWGGTPPVVTDLPEGIGSVQVGDAIIATSGPWPAPIRPGTRTALLLTAENVPPQVRLSAPLITVVDAQTRRNIGVANIPFNGSGDGLAPGIIEVRLDEGVPEPRAIALQATLDAGFGEGEPFTWSRSVPEPPPATSLPFTGKAGTVTIESAGLWPKPDFSFSPDVEGSGGSYLIRYRGMPPVVSSFAVVFDSRTREVIGQGFVVGGGLGDRPVSSEGLIAVYTGDSRPEGGSFYVALTVISEPDTSGFAQLGPFAWEPRATTPPPAPLPPGSVTLGPVTVTTDGEWTPPKQGDIRRVVVSGLSSEAQFALVYVVDTVTREVIATAFVEAGDGPQSVDMPITADTGRDSRFALQVFIQEWGTNEGESMRWVTPATQPSPPRALSATLGPGKASATISWEAPASDGDSAVTGYSVATDPASSGCEWTEGPLQCQIDGLSPGTTYTFTAFATNALGRSEASAPVTLTVPANRPGAVTGLAVKPARGKGTLTVTWKAPATDGGAVVTGYQFRVGKAAWRPTQGLRVNLTGLRSKRAVTVSVRAVNSVGPGPATAAKGTPR